MNKNNSVGNENYIISEFNMNLFLSDSDVFEKKYLEQQVNSKSC